MGHVGVSVRVYAGVSASRTEQRRIYTSGGATHPVPPTVPPPHPQGALVEVMNAPTPQARASKIEEFLEENVRVGDLLLYFLVRLCWGLF